MIVVDSGALIAAADVDDRHHGACSRLIEERGEELIVPAGVVVEVCWMLGRHVSVDLEAAFLESIASGELKVESLQLADYCEAQSWSPSTAISLLAQSTPWWSPPPSGSGPRPSPRSITDTSPSFGQVTYRTSSCFLRSIRTRERQGLDIERSAGQDSR